MSSSNVPASAGVFKQGETITLTKTVQNGGSAVDLSGITSGLEFAIRKIGDSSNTLDFDGSANTAAGSSIDGDASGVLTVTLHEAETFDVAVYEFQVWVDDGTSRDMVHEGRLTIELGYT